MSGLLVKDFRLMLQRKQFFLMVLAIAVFMSFNGNYYFIVSYLTIIGAMISISTLSYDEAENCYAFLMTLPVERRDYVREKYLFGLFCGILAWLAGAAVCMTCILLKQPSAADLSYRDIAYSLVYVPVELLVLDVALPLQLKFGAEKGRLVTVVALGGVVAAAVGIVKLMELLPRMRQLGEKLRTVLEKADGRALVVAGLAVVLALTCASMAVSRRIMERRDF